MNNVADSVTMRKVVGILIGLRLKDMRARHDCLFFESISDAAPSSDAIIESGAADYLPPRRQWVRPARGERAGQNRDQVARKGIWKTISLQIHSQTLADTKWGARLITLHQEVVGVFADPEKMKFKSPPVVLIKKSKKDEFRVMAPCPDIKGRIISGILARYFEDLIESVLSDSCYSFRVNGKTYHDAVLDLIEYRHRHAGERLYVAECDLRGFYDSVCHDVAMEAIHRLARERCITPDPVALTLLCSLLGSYSFPGYGLVKARHILKERKSKGLVKWLSMQERAAIYGKTPDAAIGLAQGNPMSPVLANAVLTRADRSVTSILGEEGFYARYCDDIIIVHPDKKICAAALKKYYGAMKELKLPAHPPAVVRSYSKAHYEQKSRQPYCWGDSSEIKTAMPWVQFVGYQVHWNGDVRIRKQSIENQKAAISEVVAKVWHIVRQSQKNDIQLKEDGMTIFNKVAMRLVRSGMGDRRPKGGVVPIAEPCWIDAFPLVDKNRYSTSQMRELDRHREIALRRFRHCLKMAGAWTEKEATVDQGRGRKPAPEPFYGAPYSYYGTLGTEKGDGIYRLGGYNG